MYGPSSKENRMLMTLNEVKVTFAVWNFFTFITPEIYRVLSTMCLNVN